MRHLILQNILLYRGAALDLNFGLKNNVTEDREQFSIFQFSKTQFLVCFYWLKDEGKILQIH